MFTPSPTHQLAREHHRQMLAETSRRPLRRRHSHHATERASGAGKIIRRVTAAMAGAGIAALSSTIEHRLSRWPQWSQQRSASLTHQRHCPGPEELTAAQRR